MKAFIFLTIFFTVFVIAGRHPVFAQPSSPAPELKKNLDWLNTDKPLALSDLRGKTVLLDFWTYGCINCLHAIPELKELETKYKNELVIIGVHSGNFLNERDTENIRRVIFRYGLEHPIVNDAEFKIWDSYGVQVYPTQILIDPDGNIVVKTTGEKQLPLLEEKIDETIKKFRTIGNLNEKPISFALEKDKFAATSPLAFPGKILADEKSGRLFIADTSHNRIVVTKLDGTLLEIVGSGNTGREDGSFTSASFNHPQGMTLAGESLYVADTVNHLIRRVDLVTKKVETVAGTGEQGRQNTGGAALETSLNSPWDLLFDGKQIFAAMAGSHQIWRLDLEAKTIAPFAGSGREGGKDGNFESATFAQPSGLAFDGVNLYVADPESNLVRVVDVNAKTVSTLAGGKPTDFADMEADGKIIRLQHPLAIAISGNDIFIADTYNHKLRSFNLQKRIIKNYLGDGKSGDISSKKSRFYEPGGLSIAGNKLYVADTNNNVIRVVDIQTKQIYTLKINGLQPPAVAKQ